MKKKISEESSTEGEGDGEYEYEENLQLENQGVDNNQNYIFYNNKYKNKKINNNF